jgi:DNA invertase Pin-like site-specific DNA recombinase
MKEMMTAFAYLRVSGLAQVEGDGFERQLLACETYAQSHDLVIAQVFREEGVSGTKELEDRPALMELLTALEESNTKVILIEKLDRLARDLMVQETLIADMQKQGYTLISVHEPDLYSNDPSRKMMRQIFGVIAEYERAMIVMKLRGARQRHKAKHGRCEGAWPFGEAERYPWEAKTLAVMLELRRQGLTCEQIASALGADGHKTRMGGAWSSHVVAKILRRKNVSH